MRKFTLDKDFIIFEPLLKDVERDEKYLKISNCTIVIPAGYNWNGCTLAPDFKQTYYASCIHDALYQYKVGRKLADRVFYGRMKKDRFILSKLYYSGVRLFGWMFH